MVDGDRQNGKVGKPLEDPVVAQVTDARGRPVEGVTVAFELSTVGPEAAVQKLTNADGMADARLVLGTSVGEQSGQVRVVAELGRAIQAPFTAMALAENANSMAAAAGEGQTGHVDQPLDDRLVVEVVDGFGNPVAGVPITWRAEGGGSVSETLVPTDEDGRARVERILGPTVGQQSTVAESDGLAGSPVTFLHTAVAGDASRLTVESGSDQTAQAGTLLPAELVARLVDFQGNGVPNTAVTWVVAIGGGSVTPQNSITDNDGRVFAQWTLGAPLGEQRVDAVVSGVGVASFKATATSGAPPALFIRTQPSGTARNGIPLGRQPVIQLRDGSGNDVATAGVQVTASLGGGGELEGTTRQITDASGRAVFTDLAISGAPGRRTLVFEAIGFAQATSDEITVEAIGTTTTITSDSPDPSGAGAPVTVSFRVASDGPIPTGNVTVSDGVQSCTGSLSTGAGSCQLSLNTVGARTLTATYAGAPGLNGSSDTEGHTVTATAPPPPASTTTTITADTPDPSVSGGTVSISVRVASGAGTPTGSVLVTISGGVGTCTIQLAGGVGSCGIQLDNVGDRTFTATYTGAPGFAGSSDTEAHTVTAQPPPANNPPDADYNWTCNGLTCQFTDASRDTNGNVVGWRWDFGHDGASSTDRNPLHAFPGEGTYTVTLTATDDDNASDVSTAQVEVKAPAPDNQPPSAAFNSPSCITNQPCQFTDGSEDSDGNIVAWSWNFGPAGSSAERNPSATFPRAGTYEVTLTVTDNDGTSNRISQSVTVADAPPPPNQGPTAAFGENCDELECEFEDQSTDPDGRIESRVWDFGDGDTSDGRDPDHEYSTSGTYQVTLTVTDDDGATATATHAVTVTAPPATTNTRFEVDNPDPTDPGQPFTVTLSVSSRNGTPEGSAIVSDGVNHCPIEIGGGSGSCQLALDTSGPRTLTATYQGNSSFASSSANELHTVNPPPPAGTTTSIRNIDPAAATVGEPVSVVVDVTSAAGTPQGDVTARSDGATPCTKSLSSGSATCTLTFTTAGPRTIAATYAGNSSFAGSSSQPVPYIVDAANMAPVATIGSIGCTGMTCNFTDASTDPDGSETIAAWRWIFDDGVSTDRNPVHAYSAPGDHPVTLTVTDEGGLADTTSQTVSVASEGSPGG